MVIIMGARTCDGTSVGGDGGACGCGCGGGGDGGDACEGSVVADVVGSGVLCTITGGVTKGMVITIGARTCDGTCVDVGGVDGDDGFDGNGDGGDGGDGCERSGGTDKKSIGAEAIIGESTNSVTSAGFDGDGDGGDGGDACECSGGTDLKKYWCRGCNRRIYKLQIMLPQQALMAMVVVVMMVVAMVAMVVMPVNVVVMPVNVVVVQIKKYWCRGYNRKIYKFQIMLPQQALMVMAVVVMVVMPVNVVVVQI